METMFFIGIGSLKIKHNRTIVDDLGDVAAPSRSKIPQYAITPMLNTTDSLPVSQLSLIHASSPSGLSGSTPIVAAL